MAASGRATIASAWLQAGIHDMFSLSSAGGYNARHPKALEQAPHQKQRKNDRQELIHLGPLLAESPPLRR
jgi:hypothetical protein